MKIKSIRDDLSANEKKLADFILNNAVLLRDYSSQQLANAVGVSQSSVVKFCQKLGYKGYPDIKLAISEAVARDSNGVQTEPAKRFVDSRLNEVSDALLKSKREAITATIELNQELNFIAAIKAIKQAEKIQIFGVGISRFVAEQMAIQLLNNDKLAFALNDSAYQQQFLARLNQDDLLILLSPMAEMDVTHNEMMTLRNRGVAVLHIGKYSASTTSHFSDIYLSTIASESEAGMQDFAKRAAQQHIVDILLSMSL